MKKVIISAIMIICMVAVSLIPLSESASAATKVTKIKSLKVYSSDITYSSAKIHWGKVKGSNIKYKVKVTNPKGQKVYCKTTKGQSVKITKLAAKTKYRVEVSVISGAKKKTTSGTPAYFKTKSRKVRKPAPTKTETPKEDDVKLVEPDQPVEKNQPVGPTQAIEEETEFNGYLFGLKKDVSQEVVDELGNKIRAMEDTSKADVIHESPGYYCYWAESEEVIYELIDSEYIDYVEKSWVRHIMPIENIEPIK